MTLVPWRSGKCAVRDVTVIDTMTNSYLNRSSSAACWSAIITSNSKLDKYQDLCRRYEVSSVAIETLGPSVPSGADFINDIGKLMADQSGDRRDTSFLWQRLSISLQ